MSKSLDQSYQKLVSNIKNIIIDGQEEIEQQKVIVYHGIGELLDKYFLKNK